MEQGASMMSGPLAELLGTSTPSRGFAEVQSPVAEPAMRSPAWLERLVLDGLPRDALRRVALRIGGDADRAAAIEHSVVPKTTLARRTGGRLTLEESERTARLARLFTHAAETLGSEEEASDFLRQPHPLLEGRPPVEVGLTDLGARRVEAILAALEHGLPV
jgi:putative toxin-antitoxin system antitoxin component (TIGR02293 family)